MTHWVRLRWVEMPDSRGIPARCGYLSVGPMLLGSYLCRVDDEYRL